MQQPPCRERRREGDRLVQARLRDGRLHRARRRDLRRDVPPALRLARADRTDLVRGQGVDRPYAGAVDSLHRADRLHPEHRADRGRCGRPLRCGRGAGIGHPGGSGGHRDRRLRCGRHRDVRRPRRPDHSRGDRRDEGDRRQPHPGAGGAPGGRGDIRCADALLGRRRRRACPEATSSSSSSSTSRLARSSRG